MANAYNYSNVAVPTTLAGNVSAGATTISVVSTVGFPTVPYIVAIDYGASTEELVKVTGVAGFALTVERGFGSTSAQTHSLGAVVRPVYNAVDATDFRTHEAATSGAHGITGSFVGTTDTQTLTNKTLTSPTINTATISNPTMTGGGSLAGTYTGSPTFSGQATFTADPRFRRAVASDAAAGFEVTADSVPRLSVRADGQLAWGSGSGAADATLARDASASMLLTGALRTTGALETDTTFAADGHASFASGAEVISADNSNPTFLVNKNVGQTSDLQRWSFGGDVLAQVNSFGEANFASRTSSAAATASSGWTLASAKAVVKAGVATLNLAFTRSGSTITADATGNITDTQVGVVDSAFLPDPHYISSGLWFQYSTGGGDGSLAVNPSTGTITIATFSPTNTIASGTSVNMTFTWPLAGP